MYLGLKKLWREEGRKSRGVCERRKGKKRGGGARARAFFFLFAPPAPLSLSPSFPPFHHHARVSPVLGEEAQVQGQVEVGEGLVDEAGVAGLIPGEERENFGDGRVGRLQAAGELLVQEEARNSAVQERSRNSMKILRAGPWMESAAFLKVSLRTKWVLSVGERREGAGWERDEERRVGFGLAPLWRRALFLLLLRAGPVFVCLPVPPPSTHLVVVRLELLEHGHDLRHLRGGTTGGEWIEGAPAREGGRGEGATQADKRRRPPWPVACVGPPARRRGFAPRSFSLLAPPLFHTHVQVGVLLQGEDLLHLVKVGGVEARGEDGLRRGFL